MCRNSVEVQKSHYLSSYKKLFFSSPYNKKWYLNGKNQFSYVGIQLKCKNLTTEVV